jgi:hypothetical protein
MGRSSRRRAGSILYWLIEDGERVTQGVELGKGGVRKKICLRFRGLKEDMTQGEAGLSSLCDRLTRE